MKFIYNEEEARKKKEEIDKKNKEEEVKTVKHRTVFSCVIFGIAFAVAVIFGWCIWKLFNNVTFVAGPCLSNNAVNPLTSAMGI